jgi:phage terminase Nu1 subunit (DNA packaging protein)
MTTAEIADLFGLSDQSIRSLAREGVIQRVGRLFPVAQSTKGYVARLRDAAAGRGHAAGGAAAVSGRARLAMAQAEAQEMKNRLARRELVPESEVEAAWSEIVLRTRTAILAQPARLSAELPHLTRHDVSTIDRSLRDALTMLGSSKK